MAKMKPSTLSTITIPGVGTANPATIASAGNRPARVLVRNVGPILAFLAHEPNNLTGTAGPSTNSYRLPVTTVDVFVLAPFQTLYAVTAGVNGLLTIAVSEALPVDLTI